MRSRHHISPVKHESQYKRPGLKRSGGCRSCCGYRRAGAGWSTGDAGSEDCSADPMPQGRPGRCCHLKLWNPKAGKEGQQLELLLPDDAVDDQCAASTIAHTYIVGEGS